MPNNNARVRPKAEVVRRLRTQAGMTQQELANAAGVSKRTVETVESGTGSGKGTRWGTLLDIAAGLQRELGVEVEVKDLAESFVAGSSLGLDDSGIAHCFERLDRSHFEQLLRDNPEGPVVVINTWIENFRDICPLLEAAIRDSATLGVELVQLKDDPEVTGPRAAELGGDISVRIGAEFERIRDFRATLKPAERERVKAFTIDFIPKFSLYAVGESCLVGFFWPVKLAVNKPQLLVRGREGFFAREVWDYIAVVQSRVVPWVPPPPTRHRARRKR